MPVNLSIENIPDDEAASPQAILTEVRRLGLATPDEAAAILRADRDRR